MVKSTMTGTVTSSGGGGTAAAMAQNEQHSTLEQQPPGRLDHLGWCVVWTVQPASTLKHSELRRRREPASAVRWRVSARYDGAMPLRQRMSIVSLILIARYSF